MIWLMFLIAKGSCGSPSLFFNWDNVTIIGQVNVSSVGPNVFTQPCTLSLRPSTETFWMGDTAHHRPFLYSTDFNNASFILGSGSDLNNTLLNETFTSFISSLYWKDSETLLIGATNTLYLYYNQIDNLILIPKPNTTAGWGGYIEEILFIDSTNETFISCFFAHQVRVYLYPDFNDTYRIIGNPDNYNTTMPPSSSSLKLPYGVRHDCHGGVWISDTGNCRVLHFPQGQSQADIVIGQNDFNSGCNNSLLHSKVRGIALNQNCTIMWIGDLYRILRYTGPFKTGMMPDGVLGSKDFFTKTIGSGVNESTFNIVNSLQYDDLTRRLYVVDYSQNRALVGTTDTGVLGTILYQNLTILTGNSLLVNSSIKTGTLIIAGNLNLQNGSKTVLLPGQTIVVGRCVHFGGVLDLQVNNSIQDQTNIPLFQYDCDNDTEFDDVIVQQTDGGRSGCIAGTPNYGSKSMSVLITIIQEGVCGGSGSTNSIVPGENNGDAKNIIIGVVVAVVGCLILALIAAGILFIVVFLVRKKRLENTRAARV